MNALASIALAKSTFERDRKGGFAELNKVFRAGTSASIVVFILLSSNYICFFF